MSRKTGMKLGVLVAVGILALAGVVGAQSPANDSQVIVTDQQAQQFDQLRNQYEQKALTLQKQLSAAEIELDAAYARRDTNPDQVIKLRRQVRNLEGELEDLYMQANADATGLLSPAQRRYYGDDYEFMGSYGWSCPWDRYERGSLYSSRHGRSSGWRSARSESRNHGDCCW